MRGHLNPSNWMHVKSQLRWTLILISLGLAVPIVLLVNRTVEQVKRETYYDYVSFAEDMSAQMDERIYEIIQREEERPFEDYSFLNVSGGPDRNFLLLSPLSRLNPPTQIPGLIGYFQVNPDGDFRTPLLPDDQTEFSAVEPYGISRPEFDIRLQRQYAMKILLTDNQLISEKDEERKESNPWMDERTLLAQKRRNYFTEMQILPPPLSKAPNKDLPTEVSPQVPQSTFQSDVTVGEGTAQFKVVKERVVIQGENFQATAQVTSTTTVNPAATESHYSPTTANPSPQPAAPSIVGPVQDPSPGVERITELSPAPNASEKSVESKKSWGEKMSEITLDTSLSEGQQTDPALVQLSKENQRKTIKKKERSKRKVLVTVPEHSLGKSFTDHSRQALTGKNQRRSRSMGYRNVKVSSFEGEIDPFQFQILRSGELVFFRKVWRNNQRFIQGILLDRERFMNGALLSVFQNSKLFDVGNLLVVHKGHLLKRFQDREPVKRNVSSAEKKLFRLFSTFLSPPMNQVELVYTIGKLPASPSENIIYLLVAIIGAVLLFGVLGLYRLGLSQIDLARQRGDFVSAVSHELKTPLTSIRMYGEMLRSGWVDDPAKKKSYYDFIYFESERLSRLISNVLQLSRLNTQDNALDLKSTRPNDLLQVLLPKIETQIALAGFQKQTIEDWPESKNPDGGAELRQDQVNIRVDEDSFTQIIINLVDNALKFSSKAEKKQIDIGYRVKRKEVIFFVRDYGPGIAKEHRKKIFGLFYRAENELTRSTSGTGIGLALVRQLAEKMHARVELGVVDVGAELLIRFPIYAESQNNLKSRT